jgi:hypothetical protein
MIYCGSGSDCESSDFGKVSVSVAAPVPGPDPISEPVPDHIWHCMILALFFAGSIILTEFYPATN